MLDYRRGFVLFDVEEVFSHLKSLEVVLCLVVIHLGELEILRGCASLEQIANR